MLCKTTAGQQHEFFQHQDYAAVWIWKARNTRVTLTKQLRKLFISLTLSNAAADVARRTSCTSKKDQDAACWHTQVEWQTLKAVSALPCQLQVGLEPTSKQCKSKGTWRLTGGHQSHTYISNVQTRCLYEISGYLFGRRLRCCHRTNYR